MAIRLKISLLIVVTLWGFASFATAKPPLDKQGRPIWHEGQVRVMYWEPIGLERAREVANPHSGELLSHYYKISVFKVPKGLSEEQFANILKKNPRVRFAEPNYCVYPLAYPLPDDPEYQADAQGTIWRQRFDEAWNDSDPQLSSWSRGVSVVVAIIDWGVRETHEEVQNKLWTNPGEIESNGLDDDSNGFIDDIHGWNFSDGNNDLSDDLSLCPGAFCGHGSNVAGIVIAETNNTLGIAGHGWYNYGMIIRGSWFNGVYYAINNGASIINMSFGHSTPTAFEQTVINDVWNAGLVICAAAGNSGIEEYLYPASYDNVISVVALNSVGTASASFATQNDKVDVSAIGENVDSIGHLTDDDYDGMNGSSAACPQVSGLAAILMSLGLSNSDVKNRIEQTCNDINFAVFPGWDKYFGWGRIDCYNAVASLVPPSSLVTTGAVNQIDLTWVAPNRTAYTTDHFEIFRSESPGGPYTNIGQTADGVTLNFSDTTVNPGTTYYYVVKAVDNHALDTKYSNEDSASATGTPWTATVTETSTSTATRTITETATPTNTSTATPTATRTDTNTATPTDTATSSPTYTASASITETDTPTHTLTHTETATQTATSTSSPSITTTYTESATLTATATVTVTLTDSATHTATPTITPTATPSITLTNSGTYTVTDTITTTATPTHTPSHTNTHTTTDTLTATPSITPTLTASPSHTSSNTPTSTPTASSTNTTSPTLTHTPTISASATPTYTGTGTSDSTNTATITLTPTMVPGPAELIDEAFYPNPYSGGESRVAFQLKGPADEVHFKIFTKSDRLILHNVQKNVSYGSYGHFKFEGKDKNNRPLANGVYLYLIEIHKAGKVTDRKIGKLVVLR